MIRKMHEDNMKIIPKQGKHQFGHLVYQFCQSNRILIRAAKIQMQHVIIGS